MASWLNTDGEPVAESESGESEDRRQQQSLAYTAVAGSEQKPERRRARTPNWPAGRIYEQ